MNSHDSVDVDPALSGSTGSLRIIALILVTSVLFLVMDAVTPRVFSEPFPAILCTNVVTAQLTVICIWGTLVHGTFWIRLPWTLLLLVVSWCALAWGVTSLQVTDPTNSVLGIGLLWFFGFIVSYVPLKVAAVAFRWQIVQANTVSQNRRNRYAIRDIMFGTLLLAIIMTFGKTMLLDGPIILSPILRSSGLHRAETGLAICVFGVVSLFVKLPCIWIALAAKASDIPRFVKYWVGYCFAMTCVEVLILSVITRTLDTEIILALLVGHQIMGAVMLAVCLSLRGLGYRLERTVPKQASREPTTD